MKLVDQIVSLELSQRLKDAGFPQETFLYWVDLVGGWELCRKLEAGSYQSVESESWGIINKDTFIYSAPTASELGEQLPGFLRKDDVHLTLTIQKVNIGSKETFPDFGKWGVVYCYLPEFTHVLHSEIDESEADARAKMWLYLKHQGLLSTEEEV